MTIITQPVEVWSKQLSKIIKKQIITVELHINEEVNVHKFTYEFITCLKVHSINITLMSSQPNIIYSIIWVCIKKKIR